MKDLKDFFGQKVTKPLLESKSDDVDLVGPKRIRKKKKFFDETGDFENPPPASKRKYRKKNVEELNDNLLEEVPKVKNKKKRKAAENMQEKSASPIADVCLTVSDESVDVPESGSTVRKKRKISAQEKMPLSGSETPDHSPASANNSLLNYFSKACKSETIDQSVKPKLLTVKALVHESPLSEPKDLKKRSPDIDKIRMKLRVSIGGKGKKNRKSSKAADYDVIETLECPDDISNDVDIIVVKNGNSKSNGHSSGEIVEIFEEDSFMTPLNSKPSKNKIKIKHNGTLASFFTIGNRVPKPIVTLSEEQKQAKHNFLLSSSPVHMKKVISSACVNQQMGSSAPHPTVSHVRQKDMMHIMWNLAPVDLNWKKFDKITDRIVIPPWSSVTHINESSRASNRTNIRPTSQFDQKKALKDLKKEAGGLPVATWFKDLKDLKCANDGLIWSEKFKPKSVVHLTLANVQNVDKLMTWLTSLSDKTKRGEYDADSENDFVGDDDSCDRPLRWRRAALISGPSGIGKTAIVYAVASELGYEVLELNASSNRSGKRILHEFSEALQSHKVETSQLNMFASKKEKKKKVPIPALPSKSLILIEDADLVFADNDEGFLSTAATLAASSKRPVVFIANEKNCKHLLAKISPYLEIELHFSSPRLERLNSWLRTVCLVENISLDRNEIQLLIEWASFRDVRKCLLQLEFLKAGGANPSKVLNINSRSPDRVWQKIGALDIAHRNGCSLRNYAELLAMTDVLHSSLKPVLRSELCRHWETECRDSTELEYPTSDINRCLLTEEIVDNSLLLIDGQLAETPVQHQDRSGRETLLADMEHALISPSCLLRRSAVSLDFAPAIREIARSEQKRFASQTKRNNRYFHYLRPEENKIALKMDYDLLCQPFSSGIS